MAKINMLQSKINFNEVALRELGLNVDEDSCYVYDPDDNSLYTIKGKYIKSSEDEYPVVKANEIDLNLIENPRLMEILFGMYIKKWAARKQVEVTSYYQSAINNSEEGFFVVTYVQNGQTSDIKSNIFRNQSVRILHLLAKLNHRARFYDLSQFDIEIPKKG